jgi:hypothetical protein
MRERVTVGRTERSSPGGFDIGAQSEFIGAACKAQVEPSYHRYTAVILELVVMTVERGSNLFYVLLINK